MRENAKKWGEVVESGTKLLCLLRNTWLCAEYVFRNNHYKSMTFFTSEYESKLDAKGRLVLPARIKAQLPESGGNELVIRRGFEQRSEEHTSELQSRENLVCRLLLEK